MLLYEADANIEFVGDGVIWDNLDNLVASLTIDYGNGDIDSLAILIGEGHGNCCSFNFIDQVSYNDEVLVLEEGYYNVELK